MKKISILVTCLFLFSHSKVESQTTLLTNLEEYYKLDESSGQVIDAVGNNNSSSVSATYSASGKINTAFSFNGSTQMVTFNDHDNWTISPTSTLSISAWINLTGDITANGYGNIWGYQDGPQFYLKYVSSGNYYLGWYAGSSLTLTDVMSFSFNTWYHVVMVKNGTSVTFYRNGTSVGTFTAYDITSNPPAVYIGSDSHSTPEAFYGRIDELGIWKRVLSSSEVAQLYNSGSGLPYSSFGGSASLPTITTTSVTGITQTTASSGGNVTSDGGASVTARGVCWSTSSNPTTANSKTTDGSGTGSFTSAITGLSANTTYHVRAYATNSVGTGYGSDIQFTTSSSPVVPVLTTTNVTGITQTTASSGGNVTSDGGASVTARGVCWSTSSNPTTANSKTTDGSGTGSFTSSITGLTANTTYHVRAYATNSVGTGYGNDVQFTTSSSSTTWQTSGNNIYYTAGSVGIGTANPISGSKLTVNGKIYATEVEVISNIGSDFVFEPDYKLMPLPDLEDFLKKNRHLPGIPSVEEFATQGQNLAKTNDLLLRKIEELTLYIIEQNKKIELLRQEMEKIRQTQ